MATEPTNPTPSSPAPTTPTAPEAPKRKAPSPINRKYLEEIELIRDLVPQAQKPERATALGESGWDAARITGLEAKATALENTGLAAVGRTKARGLNTEDEAEARRLLLAAIHPIRTGAKRKYRHVANANAGRATYFINESTNVSLERLLFIAGAILLKLTPQPPAATPEDTLPGVTPAVLQTLRDTRGGYVDANAEQQDTASQKNQAHIDLITAYTTAHTERIDLQLAADQAWSFHDPANSAIRRDFKIPPDRPMTE